MRLLILLLVFVVGLTAADYKIAGQLVQGGAPLRHARVYLALASNNRQWISSISGNQGEFSFTGLSADKYALSVEIHGVRHGYKDNEGYFTAVVTGAGQDTEHIVFAVPSPGAISGKILDEEGDPVVNAQVLLFRHAVISGRFKTQMLRPGMSNPAGEFRFKNLSAGAYFLAVHGRPWFAQYQPRNPDSAPSSTPNPFDSVYPLTYYPGTTNPAETTPVVVAEGATSELQMTLQAIPALHASVDNAPPGAMPQLSQFGPGGIEIPLLNAMSFSDSDHQEISGVAPGNYLIRFFKPNQARPERLGRTEVAFTSDGRVHLSPLQRIAISGTVSGAEGAENAIVWLENVDTASNRSLARCRVGPDGTFQFNSQPVDSQSGGEVLPGRYELRLGGDLSIKSVTVKGGGYSRGELEVRDGSQIQISITADKATKLSGVAVKEGQPFGGAMVLLIPQDFSHGSYIPRDQSNSDGTFNLNSIAPGRYILVAIEDGRDLAYHDPAIIAPYLKQGQSIQIPLPPGTETKVEIQRQKS